jgi:outer membrane protein OmpA-like peptidoglycan-associated protein
MPVRHRFAAFALAAMFAANAAVAEPLGSYFTLAPFAGYTTFDGQLHYPGTSPLSDDLYVGGRAGWQSRRWWGIEAAGGFTPTRESVAGGQDVNFWHASGNLLLTPFRSRAGDAFVSAGYGYGSLSTVASGPDATYGTWELAGGVHLWMTDAVGLRLEARDVSFLQKNPVKILNNNLVFGGGIEIALGAKTRDTDSDGVPDKLDQCPGTLHGAKVDANGCPIDSDKDGVFDGLDACPGTPRGCTVDGKGCPSDADADGVCDGVDKCPNTPKGASVDATGCPIDSDGDGVFDGIDQCPNTPKGCTVDSLGCPKDSDGDGVCDGADLCPSTPAGAKVDHDGCPIEVIERETEMLDTGMIRLQDVNFATGKADLLPEDFATLDVVGQVLTKWPELRVEIGGHTDSRGSDARNQALSEARAKSVMTYIEQKFPTLKPEQITAKGYGESRPVAPNTNALNMARNRRVEFVVINKDLLRREIERRRLMQKSEPAAPSPAAPSPVTPSPAAPDTTKTLIPVTPSPAAPDTTKK